MKRQKNKHHSLLFPGFLFCTLAAIYEAVEHGIPARREYTVFVPKELSDLKFVLISDYHENPLLTEKHPVIDQIRKEHPDVILFPGDMINRSDRRKAGSTLAFLSRLSSIAPVIASMGNHEQGRKLFSPETYQKFYEGLPKYNFYLLDNDVKTLCLRHKSVNFFGVTVPVSLYKKECPEDSLPKVPSDKNSTIVLLHTPDIANRYVKDTPLIVSGHNHGGIIRLPGIPGILSPWKFFPRYTRGCYYHKDSTLVVSAGIGSHTLPARLFNRIEYSVINTKQK